MKRLTRRTKVGDRTLFFTASWCPPCQAVKKMLNANTALARATSERLLVVDIDTVVGHELEEKQGVRAVPTFIRPDGERQVGGLTVAALAKWMDEKPKKGRKS